jgi:hypothetical protein
MGLISTTDSSHQPPLLRNDVAFDALLIAHARQRHVSPRQTAHKTMSIKYDSWCWCVTQMACCLQRHL